MNEAVYNIQDINKKSRLDVELFRIGRWIFIPFVMLGLWLSLKGYQYLDGALKCRFLSSTGLPCPGCGGTHAVVSLFRGRIWDSVKYHMAVVFGILEYAHFMGLFLYRKYVKRNIIEKPVKAELYFYAFIAVMLLQWVVKLVVIILNF